MKLKLSVHPDIRDVWIDELHTWLNQAKAVTFYDGDIPDSPADSITDQRALFEFALPDPPFPDPPSDGQISTPAVGETTVTLAGTMTWVRFWKRPDIGSAVGIMDLNIGKSGDPDNAGVINVEEPIVEDSATVKLGALSINLPVNVFVIG